MNTLNHSSFEFPVEAQSILDIGNGLILVSGEAYSGKSTTLKLMAEAFSERVGPEQVAFVDFNDNGFDPDSPSVISFAPFSRMRDEEILARIPVDEHSELSRIWGNSIARALTIPDPWVVVIDDMPAEFYETAASMALTGRIVIASMHAGSAEDAVKKYGDLLNSDGSHPTFLMKHTLALSLHQKLDTTAGKSSLQIDTFMFSDDESDDSFK